MFKNNPHIFLRHSVLILIALALLMTLPASSVAGAQPTLRPDPPALGLRSGEQGMISLQVADVQNMYGLEFHLTFDPNIVEVADADASKPGVQIKPGDWFKNSFVATNKADNTTGKIDFAVTLLNPAPPVSGDGVTATITFRAKNNGTSPLKVEKAILASRDGKEIKSVWQDGAIGVSPMGQAPSVKQTARGSDGENAPEESVQAFPVRAIILLGVAGMGAMVFLGALVLVGILFLRRR
jgi:hypothetical protein